MEKFLGYCCSVCNTEYSLTQDLYVCPKDGGNLDVIMDIATIKRKYEIEDIRTRNEYSLWRYLPILPVNDPAFFETSFRSVGWTPVYSPKILTDALGLRFLWIKDEGRNPTASFKDRASAIVLARAKELKSDIVITASTGNAGAALAGLSAAVGQKSVILAPKNAPSAKIAQLLVFGAQVFLVDGNYDDAFDLSLEAAEAYGWYCRNTGYNPFTLEGKKTASFEIWEQIILKQSGLIKPLSIFVSVGDGNIISGIHKGFKELFALGWIEVMPRIFGIQSENSSAIANAFFSKTEEIKAVDASTIADSISVNLPRDGLRGLRAAKQTNGSYITVSDDEIIHSIAELGKAGIFAEPAGATAYAGLKTAIKNNMITADDPVLVINTGSGLKDISAAMKSVNQAPIIKPTLNSLRSLFEK